MDVYDHVAKFICTVLSYQARDVLKDSCCLGRGGDNLCGNGGFERVGLLVWGVWLRGIRTGVWMLGWRICAMNGRY